MRSTRKLASLFFASLTCFSVRKSFQEGDEAKIRIIKKADIATMTSLFNQTGINFNRYRHADSRLSFTDIGGGSGLMLEPFIQMNLWMIVHCVEPDEKSLIEYDKKIQRHNPQLACGQLSLTTLESAELKLPPSDVILCSHSLYYSARFWKKSNVPLQEHLFTKLLSSLKEQGVLCVILQSENSSQSPGVAINQQLESVIYPLNDELEGRPRRSLQQQPNFANAELFRAALLDYQRRLHQETGVQLQVKSAFSLSLVMLEQLNFTPDVFSGRYEQPADVHRLLMSYTRQQYDRYTPQQQKELLDFIRHNCRISENSYGITHVNECFVITLDKILILPGQTPLIFAHLISSEQQSEKIFHI
jgi:hypothetical protein